MENFQNSETVMLHPVLNFIFTLQHYFLVGDKSPYSIIKETAKINQNKPQSVTMKKQIITDLWTETYPQKVQAISASLFPKRHENAVVFPKSSNKDLKVRDKIFCLYKTTVHSCNSHFKSSCKTSPQKKNLFSLFKTLAFCFMSFA